MTTRLYGDILPDNDQTRARQEHFREILDLVGAAYPNRFDRSNVARAAEAEDTVSAVVRGFRGHAPELQEGERPTPEQLEAANAVLGEAGKVRISGRLATPPRVMGKAAFVHLSDGMERLQIYVRRQEAVAISNDSLRPVEAEESGWKLFQLLDHGDFVGVEGRLFVTKTGELSVHVETIQFLSKALLPMPDKMHGISDPEVRQRQRYADLIASSLKVRADEEGGDSPQELSTREVFERRSKLITALRRHLDDHGYVEVETPMLSPIASGAAARPFTTHHNALDIDLYLRIAPELYLKRLLVGGFERVYELNRNFRNEGVSTRHNPEFTMLEFYTAYKDVNWMMDFCEEMIREAVRKVTEGVKVPFDNVIDLYVPQEGDEEMLRELTREVSTQEINFGFFERISMKDAISAYITKEYNFIEYGGENFSSRWLNDYKLTNLVWSFARKMFHDLLPPEEFATPEIRRKVNEAARRAWAEAVNEYPEKAQRSEQFYDESGQAGLIVEIFELMVEKRLIQPTFITDFPKSVSPLSKASPDNPTIAERFELYVMGMEVANGFSELNDPAEQLERFEEQARQREGGDDEAMQTDLDYVRALSYGMPPAAGIGIGVDRLTMLLTNRRSIRDVILFPHMRPQKTAEAQAAEGEEPPADS
ncbi:MAG TPA: lysine--tRNA ligase [Pyrinomonadaceae bacterium]|jgi:lysyl-tRNA synthetase class 2